MLELTPFTSSAMPLVANNQAIQMMPLIATVTSEFHSLQVQKFKVLLNVDSYKYNTYCFSLLVLPYRGKSTNQSSRCNVFGSWMV